MYLRPPGARPPRATLGVTLIALLWGSLPIAVGTHQAAAQGPEATLGGGSDISGGAIVAIPQGVRIPSIHTVFADNPEAKTIVVEFIAKSRAGIDIVPEQKRLSIPPGGKVVVPFSIEVREPVPAGDHAVSVQLVRADIPATAGQVTHIPAVGVRFTVRVTGTAATVVVRSVDSASKKPVEGTLVLSAVTKGSNDLFEVNRGLGSTLTTQVAPGGYEAALLLGERKHAAKRVEVKDGGTVDVTLAVETVSFVVTAAKPVIEDGQVVVADLVVSIQNQLDPIPGGVRLQARVTRNTGEAQTTLLRELDVLPSGLTEATATYRPQGGWRPGRYRFTYELVTPGFTLRAAKQDTIEVGGGRSASDLAPIAAAVSAAGAVGAFVVLRRRRRS